MNLSAINSKTGKVVLSHSGNVSETMFKQMLHTSFPDEDMNNIVLVSDGTIIGKERIGLGSFSTSNKKSVVIKGSFCLLPDSKILTNQGTKPIKDIEIGDMVFTHLGRLRKVARKYQREWDGKILNIRTILDKDELSLTANHNVLAVKGAYCNKKEGQVCKPNCQSQFNKKEGGYSCHQRPHQHYKMEIIPAGGLTTDDFLFLPKLNNELQIDNRQYFSNEQGSFVQITSITESDYHGNVFDLEVEEDHSYIANGKAIKNSDLGGYASLNREIAFRLLNRGFAVKLDVLKTAPQVDPVTMAMINALASVKLPNESECPFVVGFTPMPVQHRKGKVIFFTMMESSGGIHSEFIDRCNRYASEIWVPCKFYFDAFKKAGLVKPMYLMPLGVNEKIFTPEAKEPQVTYDNVLTGEKIYALPKSFRFISLFGWSFRKGPDVLCRSFLREFSSRDDACLVIYSRFLCSNAEEQKEYVRNEIRNYYKEVGKENPPPIYYCGDVIPINDLPGCYAVADCFVFCSRGEGFALTNVEAGACGIPVISTNNTAMQQYLDEDVAFLVETDELATANDKLTFITEFYRDQLFPVLGEKAITEFQRHMRTVYSTNEGKEKAVKFRERVLKEYTWDVCTDRVAERLENIIRIAVE